MFLFGKWKAVTLKMMELRKHYIDVRVSESISVHRTFIYRTLPMLYKHIPEAEELFGPYRKFMVDLACRPDNSADYEKGVGWHYYSAVNSFGQRMICSGGYYKNGVHRFHKSARTMMEEDYTMALTFYKAGYAEKGLEHLTRAIHMLADMCCLPHGTGMTYYSPKKKVHQAYEDMARAMYPDAIPEQDITAEELELFSDRSSFTKVLNSIVENQIGEYKFLLADPVAAITHRLHTAEKAICALIYRFYNDISLPAEEVHSVPEGAVLQLDDDFPPYSVHITKDGISLLGKDTAYEVFVDGIPCNVFRLAHRRDGLFTVSPASDKNGRIIAYGSQKLYNFSPHKKKLYFAIKNAGSANKADREQSFSGR